VEEGKGVFTGLDESFFVTRKSLIGVKGNLSLNMRYVGEKISENLSIE